MGSVLFSRVLSGKSDRRLAADPTESSAALTPLACRSQRYRSGYAGRRVHLGAKPIVQFRKIKVPPLPIVAYWVSGKCARTGLAQHGFKMHVEEARGLLWTHRCLPQAGKPGCILAVDHTLKFG